MTCLYDLELFVPQATRQMALCSHLLTTDDRLQ